jgi:carbamoyltransferase
MRITELDAAVSALLDQKVVAIFHGPSEWGPRALGNRSLLFDPRNPDAKEIMNRVKGREPWRPFAASILLDHAADYFDMGSLTESPYMTFSIPAKQEAKHLVPAVVHVDGTCRIQTVTKERNGPFWDLIHAFYVETRCPMLFNTSFNLAGEPIVETIDHAADTVSRSAIDFLYTP